MSGNAPVALFVYNRPLHARRTLEALQRNEMAADTDLIVYCDGAKDTLAGPAVSEIREWAGRIAGFRSVRVVAREVNLGLAGSIIAGVSATCAQHGRVIVLEDDLVTAPFFLRYMNQALRTYADDTAVGSIHGYWYPIAAQMPETFFLRGASCWGWATWSRAWRLFEPDGRRLLSELRRRKLTNVFDLEGAIPYARMLQDQVAGKNDSWAIRWHASLFLENRLQLSPRRSLVQNIGFDGTGTHCGESEAYRVDLAAAPIEVSRGPIVECEAARAALIQYHRRSRRSIPRRVFGRVRRLVGI